MGDLHGEKAHFIKTTRCISVFNRWFPVSSGARSQSPCSDACAPSSKAIGAAAQLTPPSLPRCLFRQDRSCRGSVRREGGKKTKGGTGVIGEGVGGGGWRPLIGES